MIRNITYGMVSEFLLPIKIIKVIKMTVFRFFRLIFISCCVTMLTSCIPLSSNVQYHPLYGKNRDLKIDLLSSVSLKLSSKKFGKLSELSGIAWDDDDNKLYTISNKGILHHLKVIIQNNQITDTKLLASYILKNKKGKRFSAGLHDSEGLTIINDKNGIKNDTELLISFEGKPRIFRYSNTGKYLSSIKLPEPLKSAKNYRNKNKMLEAITIHPTEGVITAAEYPLKKYGMKQQVLYSQSGKEWHFPAGSGKASAITGLETLADGSILVLERSFTNLSKPIIITLRQVFINQCQKKSKKTKLIAKNCPVKQLAYLSNFDGWFLDNFEGLAKYKHNHYFMISDNNSKKYQNNLLVLFKVN